jgi:uncharacterized protein YkwD
MVMSMLIRTIAFVAAVAAIAIVGMSLAGAAGCSQMRAYAQASANDMASRDTMGDHDYFHRRPHVGGENIGWGYKTEARMVAAWWRSPGHAANMRLPHPCKVVASARSRSGKLYWAMEVGP